MRGSEACIKSKWVSYNDWILDAEPTNGQIQVAHKGRIWFEIEVTGHTAHASTPWKGADAIAAMSEIIRFIHDAFANSPVHPDLGKSTVTFGQITGGYRPYIEKDKQSPLLATLKKICKNVTDYSPVISYFPGYTDTAVIAGTLGNHNCMSYGPGNLECAHQPDEWVHIQDIIRCEQVYHEIANSIFES